MNLIKDIPFRYWLTALVLLLIYLAGLRFDLVIDSGKYASVSKTIFETGDLIRLKIFDEPYDQKPPFMFWLAALSFKLFGTSNFAFKLPTFLFTLFGTFATFKLGEALYGKQTGILAAIMLITSQCMLLYNNDTHTDVILTMCIIISIWQLHKFTSKGNWLNYFIGFVFIGFAVITKGPLGLAVPVFAVFSHILIKKKYKLLSPQLWLPGLLVVIVIATPVLFGLYQQFGVDGLKFFFWTNNVGRITGSYTGGHNDILFCFHTILYLFLPFSLLVYFGTFHEIKNWSLNRFSFSGAREGITLAAPIFLIILSGSRSQSPHYMLPVIPLIAIFTAKWGICIINGDFFSPRLSMSLIWTQHILMFILVCGTLLIPILFFPTNNPWFWIPIFLMAGLTIYIALKTTTVADRLIHLPILSILLVNLIFTLHLFPEIFKYNATPMASRDFNKSGSEKATLHLLNNLDYEASFYAKNHPNAITNLNLAKLELVEEPWVYTDSLGRIDLQNAYPDAQTIKHYKYRRVSKINLKFMQPSQRFSELSDMYLVKIKK